MPCCLRLGCHISSGETAEPTSLSCKADFSLSRLGSRECIMCVGMGAAGFCVTCQKHCGYGQNYIYIYICILYIFMCIYIYFYTYILYILIYICNS